ncbi:MAG: histidine kinase dimerization/phospho-acceptor domain-containing protein, partial [bacterium]
ALADLLAAGIHKVQLLQERNHTFHSFQQFADVSGAMATAMDLDTALQKIAQAAVRALPMPAASVAVFELMPVGDWKQSTISSWGEKGAVAAGDGFVLSPDAAPDENTETPSNALSGWPCLPLRQTRGLAKRLLRYREITVRDIDKSRLFSEAAKTMMAQHHIRSYFGLPIFLKQDAEEESATCATPLLLLSLYAHAPHELDQLDRTMLRVLAAQAAQVLERIRLRHQHHESKAYFDGLRRSSMEELENLVYVISHNLKTPVISIQGFANILEEEVGPSLEIEHRHFLERIRKNASAMEKMVLDLLEFSRLGRAALKLERVNVKALVQGVIDGMCWSGQAG